MERSSIYAQSMPRFVGYTDGMSLLLKWLAGSKSFQHSTINWSIEQAGTMEMLTG